MRILWVGVVDGNSGGRGERPIEVERPLLGGREPAEGLMRTLVVVLDQPGLESGSKLIERLPVLSPDDFDLHGLDEALGDSVASGTADRGERVIDVPRLAQLEGVVTRVLRPVVGSCLEAIRRVGWCSELLPQRILETREHVWRLLTLVDR